MVYGYIESNPALSVRLRRSKHPYTDRTVMLTAEQAQTVLNACRGHIIYPAVVLALYYGLRRSEVLGLKWSAIDFERNEMRIEHTVVKSLTIEAKDSTKTDSSHAVYELLPDVREMLLEMKDKAPRGSDYVMVWEDGHLMRPDYLTRAFQKQLAKHGLPKMRFHDLRHSTASVLFDLGMSLEEVKNWLRHTDIETTSNIYLHYGRGRRKIISGAVSGIFKI